MNTNELDTNDAAAESENRYTTFSLSDDDLVIFDRENPNAWIRALSPTTVRT